MSVSLTVTRECPVCNEVRPVNEFKRGHYMTYADKPGHDPVCDHCAEERLVNEAIPCELCGKTPTIRYGVRLKDSEVKSDLCDECAKESGFIEE